MEAHLSGKLSKRAMTYKSGGRAELTRQQILDAARMVFRACGVGRSSLEQIARFAGVTKGAVYWHFENKQDLFFAMCRPAMLPLIDHLNAALGDEAVDDPFDRIQRALQRFIELVTEDLKAREVLEIVRFRCEYVDEFDGVHRAIKVSQDAFRVRLEAAYRRAARMGLLRAGLDPALLASDTTMFAYGLLDAYLAEPTGSLATAAPRLIAAHIALRRA